MEMVVIIFASELLLPFTPYTFPMRQHVVSRTLCGERILRYVTGRKKPLMPSVPRLPQYRLILLPIDGSLAARHAATHAAALANALGATVAILAVMDTGGTLAFTPEATARYARLRTEAQAAIEEASKIMGGAGIPLVEHLIMDGVPATMIVETAAEVGADLIVLSVVRGGGGNMLDEIAAQVLHDSSCPVLFVTPPTGNTP